MKKWGLLLLILVVALTGCGSGSAEKGEALPEDKLTIGVTAGPHEQIFEKVAEVAKKDGLEIDVKVFNEYVMPNVSLSENELDANSFQTQPYLDQFKKDRKLDIVEVFDTVTFPLGIYSNKIKSLDDIKKGDKLGIQNDPINLARALQLYEKAGLIKLKKDAGMDATQKDIVENPKNVKFVELEASQIPRQLDELTAATVNTNFAIEHGLKPKEDSLFIEGDDSPHVNLIAVRGENKNDKVLKKLEKAYRSKEVKDFILKEFDGAVLPSW
ncbi:MetQ/NlpA family ABC transporter substrate-binding protein [Fictibacillus aquaticus]|uniref:Lipoprotein n=1 Tax=Fictibacillus aquaticus TaxID=2021314 RepID=A0A235F7U6_9BACL|nr:MetQ/NlpA family ABC transporter substrate-binding protein [Fictibacillus aquaticus]OYD57302.1 metal ABC transporter substrate-binding protein [Fictibacillus aquaticus]